MLRIATEGGRPLAMDAEEVAAAGGGAEAEAAAEAELESAEAAEAAAEPVDEPPSK